MKVRIISSMIGLVILTIVLAFFDSIILNISLAIICFMGMYEFLKATDVLKNKLLSTISFLPSLIIPFLSYSQIKENAILGLVFYTLAMFAILLPTHDKTSTEMMSLSLLMSVALPFSLTTIIFARDEKGMLYGIFYVFLILCGAWISDTGAYFSGYFFGKHKLAPKISPKKTIEGAVGGVVSCILSYLLLGFIFETITRKMGLTITVSYISLLLVAPIVSLLSIVGDLSASIIKRQHNIKDFGNIMPGHGGILDRFDSVFYVAGVMFLISNFIEFINF